MVEAIATEIKCPICNAQKDKRGRPFTRKTLAGHIGGAHASLASNKRKGQGTRSPRRPFKPPRGIMVSANSAASRRPRAYTKGMREGMARVLPFKKGAFLIVVDGIADPFIAYQGRLTFAKQEEDEHGES